jgi:hypothetical protein
MPLSFGQHQAEMTALRRCIFFPSFFVFFGKVAHAIHGIMFPYLLFGALVVSSAASISRVHIAGTTIQGREVAGSSEFLGIPFAKAERWKTPEDIAAADIASGTFNATTFGPCCPQIEAVFAPNQKEDCLNLNVFTKDPNAAALAPVLFFIHGGGGTTGCSAQSEPALYNGTNLIGRSPEPVVVVTVNYRLSVLSNLYLEDAIVDGLQARDWLSALRWVNKHISTFGGDPSRVTIFGQSMGANAVQQLAITPGGENLFHHFISESGTTSLATGYQNRSSADSTARKVAAQLNCTEAAPLDILACLNKLSAHDIQNGVGLAQLGNVVGGAMMPVYPTRAVEDGGSIRWVNGYHPINNQPHAFDYLHLLFAFDYLHLIICIWLLTSGCHFPHMDRRTSPSLTTMTMGWNDPDNFNLCASAAGQTAGPAVAAGYLAQVGAVLGVSCTGAVPVHTNHAVHSTHDALIM